MAAQRQRCDHGACEHPAMVFGFPRSIRSKACQDHALEVIGNGVPLYSISAFSFIETVKHVPSYLERQGRVMKGKEHLKALEARCDREWNQGSQQLAQASRTVQTTMELVSKELAKRAQHHYRQMKQRLQASRINLERLVVDRDFELNSEDAALCQAIPDGEILRVGGLMQVVMAHFQLWPEEAIIKVELAADPEKRQVGLDVKKEPAANVEEPRRVHQITEESSASRKALIKGKTAKEEGQYAEALKLLEQARRLLSVQGGEDAELSLQLGLMYAHFGRRQEAEVELKRGLHPEFDPANSLSVQVRTALAECYFQRGTWRDVIEECRPILQTWKGSAADIELLKALFFLVYSHYQINQRSEGDAVMDQWTWQLEFKGPLSVLLFLQGEKFKAAGNKQAAVDRYRYGLEQNQLPASYITVVSRLSLGVVYDAMGMANEAMDHFVEAFGISAKHFPFSLAHANSLTQLSVLKTRYLQAPMQTEVLFQRACKIYTDHFPSSLDFANCLFQQGLFYKLHRKQNQAETSWLQACDIYFRVSSHSLDYAKCLNCLASLYEHAKRYAQASQNWERACALYQAVLPDSLELASCLHHRACLHQTMRLDSAEQLFLEACRVYRVSAPRTVQLARCLESLGSFYRARKTYNGAVAAYREALEIFTENGWIQRARPIGEKLDLCIRLSV